MLVLGLGRVDCTAAKATEFTNVKHARQQEIQIFVGMDIYMDSCYHVPLCVSKREIDSMTISLLVQNLLFVFLKYDVVNKNRLSMLSESKSSGRYRCIQWSRACVAQSSIDIESWKIITRRHVNSNGSSS